MAERFPIRFDTWYRGLSTLLLLSPADSYVEVDSGQVAARMAWGFRARFPVSAVVGAAEVHLATVSRGVHGLFGRWLVNGSGNGLVSLDLQPAQRGWVMGFPVSLKQLVVSVEDPAGLLKALGR